MFNVDHYKHIRTNLGFESWTEVFGSPNMTVALVGQVIHKGHIIEKVWESYRFKPTRNREGRKTG